MKRLFVIATLTLLLAACSDRAAELYETAQFEEVQRNIPHAVELYRDILTNYPDSPEADLARKRLAELEAK